MLPETGLAHSCYLALTTPPRQCAGEHPERGAHAHVLAWLIESRGWSTPLHHISCISAPRARKLLRAGADPLAWGNDVTSTPATTPLALAKAWLAAGGGVDSAESPGMEACELLIRACEPWSPANHSLFPAPARARAVELLCVGHHAFANKPSLLDCWLTSVMPMSIGRGHPNISEGI